jgi:hypothetical protein
VDGKQSSRRDFLRVSALAAAGSLAACVAPAAPPQVVTQEKVVTKEVEKEVIVKETVVVEAPAAEPVTLSLQNWFGESDMWAWQIGLDKVKAAYPDINIKLEYNDYGQTAVQIIARAAAGDVPDLIMASNEHTPILACMELLLDLNPFIEREPDTNPDDFAAGVSQGFNMWGHWWGFPYDHSRRPGRCPISLQPPRPSPSRMASSGASGSRKTNTSTPAISTARVVGTSMIACRSALSTRQSRRQASRRLLT